MIGNFSTDCNDKIDGICFLPGLTGSSSSVNVMDIFNSAPRWLSSSWLWLYVSWIYNHICNQCLSSLTVWVRIPLRRVVLDTALCDKVCQWPVTSSWHSSGSPVSFTNKEPPTYNWNIVKSDVKHHKPNQPTYQQF
jgi:hypothetical protein